jgi:predicted nuclease with TOPRIM domain
MRKIILLMVFCSFLMVTACENSEKAVSQLKEDKEKLTRSLNDNKAAQEKLTQRVKELEGQVETYQKEVELFTTISNLSREFVKAHTSGDHDKLQSLLSNELALEQDDNKLYIIDEADYRWQVYNAGGEQLDDWVIQGFQFNNDDQTYMVHIREFYQDKNGEPVSPPTFLNLIFKLVNNEWKVGGLSFDV